MVALERENAIKQAEYFRDYQLECSRRVFEAEKDLALKEYIVGLFFFLFFNGRNQMPLFGFIELFNFPTKFIKKNYKMRKFNSRFQFRMTSKGSKIKCFWLWMRKREN